MGNEWKTVLLKDVCSKIGSGATPKGGSSVYLPEGEYSLIRSQNIRNDAFSHSGLAFIEKYHADKLSNVTVEENDILLNITGDSVARCCQVDPSVLPARVNQHVAIIRPKSTILDARFLRYYFISPIMQNEMLSMAGIGATRNALTKGMIENFEIPLPPFPEQKAIAHVLGALDDKIELNRRMNATLEGMAQALFKSWFVDFDPVLDNALAAGNPIPDALEERAETRRQALADGTANRQAAMLNANSAPFPATFHFTEDLGWIPEGWKARKLSDFCDVKHGFAFKGKYFSDEKTEDILVTPGNFHIGGGFKGSKLKYYKGPIDDNYILNEKDLIVTMTDLSKAGDTLGYSAFVPKSNGLRYLHNQRIGRVLIKDTRVGKSFLNQIFRSRAYRNEILGSMSGSTVKHTSPSKILAFTFPFSGGKLEDAINSQCEALESKVSQNNDENITLAKLRDTLLPKLISGELRIPDAEKLAAEALA